MQSLREVEAVLVAADVILDGWLLGEPPVAYGASSPKLLERTQENRWRDPRTGEQGRHREDGSIL